MSDLFGRPVIDSFKGEYAFLSNFWLNPVVFGDVWPSSEHAYQAAKCYSYEDHQKFRNPNMTPGQAKRLGKQIQMRDDWEDIKFGTMLAIVTAKFRDTELHELLLQTNDAILIEGNNWGDRYWGQVDGVGENNLGKILMHVRAIKI